MIALTKEKREELKVFLSASIEGRCTVYTLAKQRELEALRDQIALSSLTAEPFGYIKEDAVKDRDRLFSAQVFADEEDLPSYEFSELNYPLYLSPPVAEIKLPDDNSCEDGLKKHGLRTKSEGISQLSDGFRCGFAWYEHETKRLNGWGE